MQVEQVLRRGVGPALHTLLTRHLFHDDAEEVAAILAFGSHPGLKLWLVEAGKSVKTAVVPGLQQVPLVAAVAQVAESRFEQVDDIRFHAIDREVPRGQQHVIEQRRSRASATQHKYRGLAAGADRLL